MLEFTRIGLEGPDVGQIQDGGGADEEVAVDDKRPFAGFAEFNLERIDAGGGAEQRGGEGREADQVFGGHQNFRLRLR